MRNLSAPILTRGPFHRAPPVVQTTIAIRSAPNEPPRKVTKIIGYREGGLAMLSPYHSAKSGLLTKTLVDYRQRRPRTSTSESEMFSAADRVKLSYHVDGFVQFSGERQGRIVSGRDPMTGEPKGLGVVTNPMQHPVMTGPAFGVTLWGLEEFAPQAGAPRGDSIVFEETDFVYEQCDEASWGSSGVSFFVFTLPFQPFVRKTGPRAFEMPLWHSQFMTEGRAFNFKVVRLGRQPFFLGAICFRRPKVRFDSASGWVINGPGGLSDGPVKPVLHAFYPAEQKLESMRSLDLAEWGEPRDPSEPQGEFGRDYATVSERIEAEFGARASREVPELDLLRKAAALVARILDGVVAVPDEVGTPEGLKKATIAILTTLGVRTARACSILIAAGYVPEASVLAARLVSALILAGLVEDDVDGDHLRKVAQGATLAQIDPAAWSQLSAALAHNLTQVPQISTVEGAAGPRAGISLGPSREPRQRGLALGIAVQLTEIARVARDTLLEDSADQSLAQELAALTAEAQSALTMAMSHTRDRGRSTARL